MRLTTRGAAVLSGAVVLLAMGVALNLPLLRAVAGIALGAVARSCRRPGNLGWA